MYTEFHIHSEEVVVMRSILYAWQMHQTQLDNLELDENLILHNTTQC